MKVKLIAKTPDIVDVIYVAAHCCYNSGSVIEDFEKINNIEQEKKIKLIKACLESGHHSVLEHVNFTFAIEGISRAATHQLVRHRHCSFSQQSQRYCNANNSDFVYPIFNSDDSEKIFTETLEVIKKAYKDLINIGIKKEDARAILPNCTASNICITLNLRELIHIANERLCTRAQKEIRKIILEMCSIVGETNDWLYPYLVPKCEKLGYCPEHNGCGRKENKKCILK